MRRVVRSLSLLLLLVLLTAQVLAAPRVHHVVVVSFDGGRPDIMQQSKMPVVFAMARRGACTWQARTVFPSITLVSHTSMLTGAVPAGHGIDWNDWIPARGLVKVPTIFSLARAQHLSTALFAGKEKFAHLLLSSSFDSFNISKSSASQLAEDAGRYIVAHKPNLCFVHFTDTDSTGHGYGWGSAEQKTAFAEEDRGVGILRKAVARAGIANDTVFILTADHGGHAKTHGSDQPEDMTIPWIAFGTGVESGKRIDAPVMTCDTAATVLWLLDIPSPANLDGKPVTTAFKPEPAK